MPGVLLSSEVEVCRRERAARRARRQGQARVGQERDRRKGLTTRATMIKTSKKMHLRLPVFFWYLVAISSSSTDAFISRPTVSRLYSIESIIVPCSTTRSPMSLKRSASSLIDLAMLVISFVRWRIVESIRDVACSWSVYREQSESTDLSVNHLAR